MPINVTKVSLLKSTDHSRNIKGKKERPTKENA
jgi:hypothetical protein